MSEEHLPHGEWPAEGADCEFCPGGKHYGGPHPITLVLTPDVPVTRPTNAEHALSPDATIAARDVEIEKLREALSDARNCLHGNDIVRSGVRLTKRIDALLSEAQP